MAWIEVANDTKLAVLGQDDGVTILNIITQANGTISAELYSNFTGYFEDVTQRSDNGNLILVDASVFYSVQEYTVDGNWVRTLVSISDIHNAPIFSVLCNEGYLWVASNQTILKYNLNQTSVAEKISCNSGIFIRAMQFLGSDILLVVGTIPSGTDGRFLVYNITSDTFTTFIDPEAAGNYLAQPMGLVLNSDKTVVYVADYLRVQQYTVLQYPLNITGIFAGQILDHGGFYGPNGILYDSATPQSLFVTTVNRVITLDRSTFEFQEEFIPSVDPPFDATNNANRIAFNSNTTFVSTPNSVISFASNNTRLHYYMQAYDLKLQPETDYVWGTKDQGLIKFLGRVITNNLTEIANGSSESFNLGIDGSFVFAFIDSNTAVIAGSAGFYTWKFSSSQLNGPYLSEYGGDVLAIETGPDGNIYFASASNGLLYTDVHFSPAKTAIPGIFIDTADFKFVPVTCNTTCPNGTICSYGECVQKQSSSRGSISTTTIIVIVAVGGAVIMGAMATVVLIVLKKKHKKPDATDLRVNETSDLKDHHEFYVNDSKAVIRLSEHAKLDSFELKPAANPDSHKIDYDSNYWEIDFTELELGNEIGHGAFGTVYIATYRNSECVVKQLRNAASAKAVSDFLKEANVVKRVRPHKNVCNMLGVCTSLEHPICIVMEFVNGGSLENAILEDKIPLNVDNLLKITEDIITGMVHVHAEGLLHCDLACRNLLVAFEKDDKFTIKVADFGLARISEYASKSVSVGGVVFPIRWSAPEVLRAHKFSKASDVWAFGVVLWEILESKVPYLPMTNEQVIDFVCDKKTLPRPTRIPYPEELYILMQTCWAYEASARPSFKDLLKFVKDIQHKVNQDENQQSNEYHVMPHIDEQPVQRTDYSKRSIGPDGVPESIPQDSNASESQTTTTMDDNEHTAPYRNSSQPITYVDTSRIDSEDNSE